MVAQRAKIIHKTKRVQQLTTKNTCQIAQLRGVSAKPCETNTVQMMKDESTFYAISRSTKQQSISTQFFLFRNIQRFECQNRPLGRTL